MTTMQPPTPTARLFRVGRSEKYTPAVGERRRFAKGEEIWMEPCRNMESMIRQRFIIPLSPAQFGLTNQEAVKIKQEDFMREGRQKRRRAKRRADNG